MSSICMLLFFLRERRRAKQRENIEFNSSLLEKARPSGPQGSRHSPSPIHPTFNEKSFSPSFVKDPPYTAEKSLSSSTAYYSRQSMVSWARHTPEDQRYSGRTGGDAYSARVVDDRLSLNSLDIEGMLNLAAVQSNRSSKQTAESAPLGPTIDSFEPFASRAPGPYPSRGHLRAPSDIPIGPTSLASALSLSSVVDPFADNATHQPGSARAPYPKASLDYPIRPPPGAVVGLPLLPSRFIRQKSSDVRDMRWAAAHSSNRSTKDSTEDYYHGIPQ